MKVGVIKYDKEYVVLSQRNYIEREDSGKANVQNFKIFIAVMCWLNLAR